MKRRYFIQNKLFNIQNYANKYYLLKGDIIFMPPEIQKSIDDKGFILFLVAKLVSNVLGPGREFWMPGFISFSEVALLKKTEVPHLSKYNIKDPENYVGNTF